MENDNTINAVSEESRDVGELDENVLKIIITECELTTKDELMFLINLEEKCLIPKYKKNCFILDATDRSCLCRLIIKNLLKGNPEKQLVCMKLNNLFLFIYIFYRLRKADFEKLASLITEVFPSESKETFFEHIINQPYTGSLWHSYCRIRREYKQFDVIPSNRRAAVKKINLGKHFIKRLYLFIFINIILLDMQLPVEIPENEKNLVESLRTEVDDWDKVIHAWSKTYTLRQTLFEGKTILEIFEMFPCLEQPNVVDLVS